MLSQIAAEELTLRSIKSGSWCRHQSDTLRQLHRFQPVDHLYGTCGARRCPGLEKTIDLPLLRTHFACHRSKSSFRMVRLISGEARLTFREALERHFGKGSGGELIGRGETTPELTQNKMPVFWEVGMGMVELQIDEDTGEVGVKRLISVADVGKAIHPEGCVGQEEGAAMMGIGHTLFEQMIYDVQR